MKQEKSFLPLRETLHPKTFLCEGKTKIIWATEDPNIVLIENKDYITAGDGARRNKIPGKGTLATTTTENVFTLLNREGIRTHFVDRYTDNMLVAKKALMIPVESVARRKAFGSYPKRSPEIQKGTRFPQIEHEFFYKDDQLHDPLMVLEGNMWHFYDSQGAIKTNTPIRSKERETMGITHDEVTQMQIMTREVFIVLEEAWQKLDVELVDLKIEFGRDNKGNLMVADVIDNDSWRIWLNGDENQDLSKQNYRNLPNPSEEDLERIRRMYAQVAKLTSHFYHNLYPNEIPFNR